MGHTFPELKLSLPRQQEAESPSLPRPFALSVCGFFSLKQTCSPPPPPNLHRVVSKRAGVCAKNKPLFPLSFFKQESMDRTSSRRPEELIVPGFQRPPANQNLPHHHGNFLPLSPSLSPHLFFLQTTRCHMCAADLHPGRNPALVCQTSIQLKIDGRHTFVIFREIREDFKVVL